MPLNSSTRGKEFYAGQLVRAGATMQCSFGAAPGTFNVLPANRVLNGNADCQHYG